MELLTKGESASASDDDVDVDKEEDDDLSSVVAPCGLGWKDNNCEEKVCEADGKNEGSGDLREREHFHMLRL